jgi:hypothetical protein
MKDDDLFAEIDDFDDFLDRQGILYVETRIMFLEMLKMSEQGYQDAYQDADRQLRYLEERIGNLRKRFGKLPPAKP